MEVSHKRTSTQKTQRGHHEEVNMKMTTDNTYGGLAINTDKAKGQACFTKVLDRYHAHLNDMTGKRSKVMQVRFDLHYPQDSSVEPSPQHLQDFNYNAKVLCIFIGLVRTK